MGTQELFMLAVLWCQDTRLKDKSNPVQCTYLLLISRTSQIFGSTTKDKTYPVSNTARTFRTEQQWPGCVTEML